MDAYSYFRIKLVKGILPSKAKRAANPAPENAVLSLVDLSQGQFSR